MVKRNTPLSGAIAGFGDRLRLARLWLGLSQAALSDRLGASASRWNHWEKNRYEPDLAIMVRLKTLYRVPLDWIFAGDWSGLPLGFTQFLVSYGAQPDAPEVARRIRAEWGAAAGFERGPVAAEQVAEAIASFHPPVRRASNRGRRKTLHEEQDEPSD